MRHEMIDVPGSEEYFAAVKRENDVRDAAELDLPTLICGRPVVPMTLRHWVILDGIDSPFLRKIGPGNIPSVEQCIQFLWVMNPKFTPGPSWRRGRFILSCRKMFYGDAVVAVEKFVSETFQDSPPHEESGKGSGDPHVSFGISIKARLSEQFHWNEEYIANMPLKRTFQYLKILRLRDDAARGFKPMGWSPSDVIRIRLIRAERERRKALKEART